MCLSIYEVYSTDFLQIKLSDCPTRSSAKIIPVWLPRAWVRSPSLGLNHANLVVHVLSLSASSLLELFLSQDGSDLSETDVKYLMTRLRLEDVRARLVEGSSVIDVFVAPVTVANGNVQDKGILEAVSVVADSVKVKQRFAKGKFPFESLTLKLFVGILIQVPNLIPLVYVNWCKL